MGCLGAQSALAIPECVWDPERMREAKEKGEVSDLERKWGKPPHLFVLSELVQMVPVVISRCWVTVFCFCFFFNSTTAAGKGEARPRPAATDRLRDRTAWEGWSQASPPRAGPAHDPGPAWSPRPEFRTRVSDPRQHGSTGICVWAGPAFNPAGRHKCRSVKGVDVCLTLCLPQVSSPVKHVGFRFASYINNYMVLQKEPAGAVIWGYGTSGATVTVTLYQQQEAIMKKVTSVKEINSTECKYW
ncbi:uncharacterized protein LOC115943912 [Leptonychotes weddellii]|uniref:Uncharacterized protein LOC115943912 n=1 Tax=Leptonychotes weddellii TaxID=9713 RepID=A0A7F8RKM1_LEPWE|nr:uncharacterized protein LOC115943912 [Leptonychotes weddellii]